MESDSPVLFAFISTVELFETKRENIKQFERILFAVSVYPALWMLICEL